MAIYTQGTRIDYSEVNGLTDNILKKIFDSIYPINSVCSSMSTTPPKIKLSDGSYYGTWTRLSDGYFINSVTDTSFAGSTLTEELPNYYGTMTNIRWGDSKSTDYSGAFSCSWEKGIATGNDTSYKTYRTVDFNAANSSSIYQDGAAVRPKHYPVAMWKRSS